MNIKKLQELEDLKVQLKKLEIDRDEYLTNRKNNLWHGAKEDFKHYFIKNRFNITKDTADLVEANYNESVIVLKKGLGQIFIDEYELLLPYNSVHKIVIFESKHKRNYPENAHKDYDSELEKETVITKNKILFLKEFNSKKSEYVLKYMFIKGKKPEEIEKNIPEDSFYSILEGIFE